MSAFSPTLSTFKERLSLLYVLNDVLFHATNTFRDTNAFVPSATIQYLSALVKSAQSAPNARSETLDTVLTLWSDKHYFSDDEFAQIGDKPVKESTINYQSVYDKKEQMERLLMSHGLDPKYYLHVSMKEASEGYRPYSPEKEAQENAIFLEDNREISDVLQGLRALEIGPTMLPPS